jgi:hypothetical protein
MPRRPRRRERILVTWPEGWVLVQDDPSEWAAPEVIVTVGAEERVFTYDDTWVGEDEDGRWVTRIYVETAWSYADVVRRNGHAPP